MSTLKNILMAGLLTVAPAAAWAEEAPVPFAAPKDSAIPKTEQGELILLGKRLMSETKRLLPDNVGAQMNCTSCHLSGAKLAVGSPLVGTANAFPQYNPRAGREVTLTERINGCFLRSMNGKPLKPESQEMKAMLAYTEWLATALPKGATKIQGKGIGLVKLDKTLVANPENGKRIYGQQCAMCHGDNGEGMKDAQGEILFPPLWGDESFNIGAGMARTYTAAAFVLNNMPVGHGMNSVLGQGGAMTQQEAVDVAEYFSHQPRPDFPAKVNDWPKDPKPKDARY
ncbi:MAG: c-type cytochrome [Magnetospirillum sp.]|nr:c-type cytochrome [Magnetospirillum sp.]